jgi:hypothetical protein
MEGKMAKEEGSQEEGSQEETWEIDPNALTLDDYSILGQSPGIDPEATKRTLAALIINKTAEELGRDYTWGELRKHLQKARRALEEAAVPKRTDTP